VPVVVALTNTDDQSLAILKAALDNVAVDCTFG
jgi:hypothetical protein